jgi:hypothetical protein
MNGVIDMAVGILDQAEYVVWLREYADIFSAVEAGDPSQFFQRYKCQVHHNSARSVLHNHDEDYAWDDEDYDDGDLHDTSTNNERLTVPAKGTYEVWGKLVYEVTTPFNPHRSIFFNVYKNGSGGQNVGYRFETAGIPNEGDAEFHGYLDLEKGDYVTLHLSVASLGGSPTGVLEIKADSSKFRMKRVGV